jgi:predicted transposase/invertase (TIGR01784 family)
MKVIPLKFGAMFKQAFSQPDVFNHFVKDVLGISFHADTIHTEYEYPEPIGFVRSTYDLFAKDEEKRIIVEIQHIKEDDFFDRFLYYHLISLVEQVGGYDEYRFNQTVYTIVVLTSTPRDGSVNFSCAVSDMNPIDEYGKTVNLYPHRLVFLCPRQVNQQTPQKIRQWLRFIEDSLDGEMDEAHYPNKIWKQIMQLIKKRDIDPAVLAKIKDEAAWEKAKKRFVAEGREEGILEGIEKGIEKGKEEGILAGKIELAKNLLDVLDNETIALKSGLSIERVRKLKSSQ